MTVTIELQDTFSSCLDTKTIENCSEENYNKFLHAKERKTILPQFCKKSQIHYNWIITDVQKFN